MRWLIIIGAVVFFSCQNSNKAAISLCKESTLQIANQSDHHVFAEFLQPFSLFVEVTGEGPFTFQWTCYDPEKEAFVNIDGATEPKFKKSAERFDNGKMFGCDISNNKEIIKSGYFVVLIDKIPPEIIVQPVGMSIHVGEAIELYARGDGSFPIGFVWMKDGVKIPEATGAVLQIPEAQLSDAGKYSCDVVNDAGAVTSDVVEVMVEK